MDPRKRFLLPSLGERLIQSRLVLVVLALLLAHSTAHARTEVLRWNQYQANQVERWEAHVGTSSGNYTQIINLPTPTLSADGALEASIEVADDTTVFIALRAIGADGRRSALSNERQRGTSAPAPPPSQEAEAPAAPPQSVVIPVISPEGAYRQDFTGFPASALVGGWIDTTENFSFAVNDNIFRILLVDGNPSLYSSKAFTNAHSHHLAPGVAWSDMVMTGRMRVDEAGAGLGVTLSSGYPTVDQYYRLSREPGGAFQIHGRPGLSCTNRSTGVNPTLGLWYSYRFSSVNESGGQRIRAKVWRSDEPEPTTDQVSCLDTTAGAPNTGTFGAWMTGDGKRYWDDFEVSGVSTGTTGGSNGPPSPPILIRIDPVD